MQLNVQVKYFIFIYGYNLCPIFFPKFFKMIKNRTSVELVPISSKIALEGKSRTIEYNEYICTIHHNILLIYNLNKLEYNSEITFDCEIEEFLIDPTGTFMIVGDHLGAIHKIEMSTSQVTLSKVVTNEISHDKTMNLAFAPTKQVEKSELLIILKDRFFKVLFENDDPASFEMEIIPHELSCIKFVLSFNQGYLIFQPDSIAVFSLKNGKFQHCDSIRLHFNPKQALIYEELMVAIILSSDAIFLYDLETFTILKQYSINVLCMEKSNDSVFLLSSSGLRKLSVPDMKEQFDYETDIELSFIHSFSNNPQRVVGYKNNEIIFYELKSSDPISILKRMDDLADARKFAQENGIKESVFCPLIRLSMKFGSDA